MKAVALKSATSQLLVHGMFRFGVLEAVLDVGPILEGGHEGLPPKAKEHHPAGTPAGP